MASSKRVVSSHGYGISKEEAPEFLDSIRSDLMVRPRVNPSMPGGADAVQAFPVFRENRSKLYVPRFYGTGRWGPTDEVRLPKGDPAPRLKFSGKLRPEQEAPALAFLEAAAAATRAADTGFGGGLLVLPCAFGKCLARDTQVLMFDGTTRAVQDIAVGDLLMGDDAQPRRVLSLARGRETMYSVTPYDSEEPYVVNQSHILSLKCGLGPDPDRVYDISIKEYLALPKWFRGFQGQVFGYRVPLAFPHVSFSHMGDPYGWAAVATKPYEPYAGRGQPEVPLEEWPPCPRIPREFVMTSADVQVGTLAGILDHLGRRTREGIKITVPKAHEALMDDIVFLAKCVGLAAFKKEKHHQLPGGVKAHFECYTTIYGNAADWARIPMKTPMPPNNKHAADVSVLRTPLKVKKVLGGQGEYFGFTIDGNHRFLLADFTVTHNTALSLYLACQVQRKTLVVCHKEFLMNQWRERIAAFVPEAKVGLIQQSKMDTEDKDIVLASLQSLAMREYPAAMFAQFGMAIFDECHHLGAEVFSRALFKIPCPVTLGLSATPERKDGLRKVFEWFIGPPVFVVAKRAETELRVIMHRFTDPDPNYRREILMFNRKPNMAGMINNVCASPARNEVIVEALRTIFSAEPGRQVIILSDRRGHLDALRKLLLSHEIFKEDEIGFYVGGMKQTDLDKSATRRVILATGAMANEGLDIPTLNTLVFASPVTSIEQPVGRIQRQKPHERKYLPLVVDVWDNFGMFYNQGLRRMKFYKKNGYEIVMRSGDQTEATGTDSDMEQEAKPEAKAKTKVCLRPDDDIESLRG